MSCHLCMDNAPNRVRRYIVTLNQIIQKFQPNSVLDYRHWYFLKCYDNILFYSNIRQVIFTEPNYWKCCNLKYWRSLWSSQYKIVFVKVLAATNRYGWFDFNTVLRRSLIWIYKYHVSLPWIIWNFLVSHTYFSKISLFNITMIHWYLWHFEIVTILASLTVGDELPTIFSYPLWFMKPPPLTF